MLTMKFFRALIISARFKKIAWHPNIPCDVLIFDTEGSDNLIYCMPSRAKVYILRTREGMPLINSISFFLLLLMGLVKYRKPGRALYSSIIKSLKPKVVITYIDNSPVVGVIKNMFPTIPILAVQNGTRWDLSRPNQPPLVFDHYFSFGSVERDILSRGGHFAAHIYPIGSVRAGLFEEKYPALHKKEFDLCYISQYSALPFDVIDKWTHEMFISYYETGKHLFSVIVEFVEKNNLSLCVAMRSSLNSVSFEEERQYYSYQGKNHIQHIPQSPFSSYKTVQASRLSVTISSTLGYEMLGLGERVIFAKDIKSVASVVMQGSWAENFVTYRLPELQRLYTLDYEEFSFKATELLNMTDAEYMDYSRDARVYYMNYDSEQKPHQIIKNKIEVFLSKAN